MVARDIPAAEGWLPLYSEATSAMFALLAGAIYGSLERSRHLAAHSRAGLELDVFDGHLLTPFAQWGQSLSLVFVGGICLSLLFQSYESLRSLEGVIVYGSLVVVSLTLFFMFAPDQWATETCLIVSRPGSYPESHKLSARYVQAFEPIEMDRLYLAGLVSPPR